MFQLKLSQKLAIICLLGFSASPCLADTTRFAEDLLAARTCFKDGFRKSLRSAVNQHVRDQDDVRQDVKKDRDDLLEAAQDYAEAVEKANIGQRDKIKDERSDLHHAIKDFMRMLEKERVYLNGKATRCLVNIVIKTEAPYAYVFAYTGD